jgi:tetratricopeptide (TPR) repeat protein
VLRLIGSLFDRFRSPECPDTTVFYFPVAHHWPSTLLVFLEDLLKAKERFSEKTIASCLDLIAGEPVVSGANADAQELVTEFLADPKARKLASLACFMLAIETRKSPDRGIPESQRYFIRAADLASDDPSTKSAALAQIALNYCCMEDYRSAELLANEAIDLDHRNVSALHALAWVLAYACRFDETERLLRWAIALDPNASGGAAKILLDSLPHLRLHFMSKGSMFPIFSDSGRTEQPSTSRREGTARRPSKQYY